jgi:hypothetical protein
MTEDIGSYTFDFEKEVNDLRRSLGSKADTILFIEANVPPPQDADQQEPWPQLSLQHIICAENFNKANISFACDQVVSTYTEDPLASSFCKSFSNIAGTVIGHFICLRESEPFNSELGDENKNVMRLFTLYHEAAHAVVPGAYGGDQDHPFAEAASDAYAALQLFQRFGQEAGALLSMVSWLRTRDAIQHDTQHLSTTVLDKIIADSAHRDFSALTSAETIDLAGSYATEWTPPADILSTARSLFRQEYEIESLGLANSCLASSDKFAFYIGAKYFQPFFQPEGILRNGEAKQLSDIERVAYARFIEERAAGMDLYRVFNRTAERPEEEPPVTTLLKVSLPAGQKQLIFNPPKFP